MDSRRIIILFIHFFAYYTFQCLLWFPATKSVFVCVSVWFVFTCVPLWMADYRLLAHTHTHTHTHTVTLGSVRF